MQETVTDIIILRGAPASGKSQTAKCLTRFFPQGVRLEIDNLRQMVISVDWKDQQEHINMLQVSVTLVHEFTRLGLRPVIVIDTFSGNKINSYLEALNLQERGLSVKIFGLFTSEEELKKRVDARSGEEFRDFGICKKINEDTIKFKSDTEVQIDTTGLLPMQTAQTIFDNIKGIKMSKF